MPLLAFDAVVLLLLLLLPLLSSSVFIFLVILHHHLFQFLGFFAFGAVVGDLGVIFFSSVFHSERLRWQQTARLFMAINLTHFRCCEVGL